MLRGLVSSTIHRRLVPHRRLLLHWRLIPATLGRESLGLSRKSLLLLSSLVVVDEWVVRLLGVVVVIVVDWALLGS